MMIYIVECDTDESWHEPIIFIDGNKAVEYLRKEYESAKEECDVKSCPDNDSYKGYDCEWFVDDYSGTAAIEAHDWVEYWRWRITEHSINEP
jgi:hypothetical protein